METIGILAGIGRLPVAVAQAAKKMGYQVAAVGVVPDVDPELAVLADFYYEINVGKIGKIIATLQRHQVQRVTLIGKVTKEVLYKAGAVIPDLRALKILATVSDRKDDTIMRALVAELEGEGIQVMAQTVLLRELLPQPGVLTKRWPSEAEAADMDFGFRMAKAIGGLDIGQTVVVKNRAVLAVEAIEGTDNCILRGGFLGKGGVIVAKAAKPYQDQRFDIPGFGVKTLESMIAAGATGIVIEAGNTLIADQEKTVALADEHNITIVVRAAETQA